MGVYYPDDYGPYASSGALSAPASSPLKVKLARFLGLDTRRLPLDPPGRMLELGCASGDYLRRAQKLGWSVQGIEFSEAAARQARSKGLDVSAGTVEGSRGPAEPVDLIVAWMVLEHLHEPVQALSKIRSWLRPGGYLVFSVPDAGALERRLFGSAWYALHMPAHLYHFSPKTIRTLLGIAGWRVVRVRWQANPRNLLMSLAYAAEDKGRPRAASAYLALANASRFSLLRLAMGWCLARLRQSGQMEVWAQPISPEAPSSKVR